MALSHTGAGTFGSCRHGEADSRGEKMSATLWRLTGPLAL